MQKIKNEKGITLIALVLTVVVLSLISVPTIINSQQIINMKKYTNFKGDIEKLSDSVKIAYKNEESISNIGPKYKGNLSFLSQKQNEKNIKNPNDDDIYYLIDIVNLNERLPVKLEELVNGDANKNYRVSPYYDSVNNTYSGNDAYIINNTSRTIYYTDGLSYKGVIYYRIPESYTNIDVSYPQNIADGTWNSVKEVNTPKLTGTGLIPIYYDNNNTEHELTKESTNEQWNQWYDYKEKRGTGDNNTSKWANAITKDSTGNVTGYFVWIPRYAYKITSNCYTAQTGTIEIKFLQGTGEYDKDQNRISKIYPNVTDGVMQDFVIHPSFTDGTSNKFSNGEWNEEIPGFWVAKYPAGFQESTINANDASLILALDTTKIVYSNIKYSNDGGIIAIGTANSTNKMSYPVFKPLTYAYNNISIGDSYLLARDIQNATGFYGLKNSNTHIQKNSEWGAVAYLTHSSYGRNNTELNANAFNLNNANAKNTYSITGLYSDVTSANNDTSISSENAYNTEIGIKGSSTGNITGVYDLNGCIWEGTTGYIANNNSALSNGVSFTNWTNSAILYQTESTKYIESYLYDKTTDENTDKNVAGTGNYKKYLENSSTRFGDSILETSAFGIGANSWNKDISNYPTNKFPFIMYGGSFNNSTDSGIFGFQNTNGKNNYDYGFRICII